MRREMDRIKLKAGDKAMRRESDRIKLKAGDKAMRREKDWILVFEPWTAPGALN